MYPEHCFFIAGPSFSSHGDFLFLGRLAEQVHMLLAMGRMGEDNVSRGGESSLPSLACVTWPGGDWQGLVAVLDEGLLTIADRAPVLSINQELGRAIRCWTR